MCNEINSLNEQSSAVQVEEKQSLFSKAKFAFDGIKCGAWLAVSALALHMNPVKIFADDITWDFLTNDNGSDADGMFDGLTTNVKGMGHSATTLFRTVGIIAMLISIVMVGISFMVHKNGQKREENKSTMLYVCIGGAIVFGATSIISLIYSFSQGIDGDAGQ